MHRARRCAPGAVAAGRKSVRSCSFCAAQLPILQELGVEILRRKVASALYLFIVQLERAAGFTRDDEGAGMIRECRRLSDGLLQLTAAKSDEGVEPSGPSQRLGDRNVRR